VRSPVLPSSSQPRFLYTYFRGNQMRRFHGSQQGAAHECGTGILRHSEFAVIRNPLFASAMIVGCMHIFRSFFWPMIPGAKKCSASRMVSDFLHSAAIRRILSSSRSATSMGRAQGQARSQGALCIPVPCSPEQPAETRLSSAKTSRALICYVLQNIFTAHRQYRSSLPSASVTCHGR